MDTPETLAEGWDYYTDLSVGEILKRTREHYGRSLYDVEAHLRIRAGQLEALENEEYDKLPGRVYVIGFIRSYSEYLGLEPDKIVKLYKIQSDLGPQRPELNFPVAASESKVPSVLILTVSFVALVLMSAFVVFYGDEPSVSLEHGATIPPVPGELKVIASPVAESFGPFLDVEEPVKPVQEIEEESHPVTLRAKENVWLEIRNKDGKVVYSGILKKGREYLVPKEEGLLMSTGNAGGLRILVDGEDIPSLGKRGDVKRHILLDPSYLKGRME